MGASLSEVAAAGFPAPTGDPRPVLDEAIESLRSLDPRVRDGMAYTLVERWVAMGAVPAEDAAWVVERLSDDGLLLDGIGGVGDAVFGRSFAILGLAACLYRDNTESFLSKERWAALVETARSYAAREVDLRGYVRDKGWAHAAAHTADLLGRLAQSPHADGSTGEAILEAVASLVANNAEVFSWLEDERLARALALAVERGVIGRDRLEEWAASETAAAPALDWEAFEPTAFARRENLRRLLRALYFRLEDDDPLRPALAARQTELLEF